MGWFVSSKKKATELLDGRPVSGHVYQPPPMQIPPYGTDSFHHSAYPNQLDYSGPPPITSGQNGVYTHPQSHAGHYYYPPPNIVVNQYYVTSPNQHGQHAQNQGKLGSGLPAAVSKLRLGSMVNLATDLLPMNLPHFFDDGQAPGHTPHIPVSTVVNQSAVLYDQLYSKFNNILTSIDNDRFDSLEAELFSFPPNTGSQGIPLASTPDLAIEPYYDPSASMHALPRTPKKHSKGRKQTSCLLASIRSGNYIAKVDLYANSRLPYDLPPMRLYIATYRLLSLAAKYSDRAYQQPDRKSVV